MKAYKVKIYKDHKYLKPVAEMRVPSVSSGADWVRMWLDSRNVKHSAKAIATYSGEFECWILEFGAAHYSARIYEKVVTK